jgi:2-hydroxychromene-2-carboxylate isomerase
MKVSWVFDVISPFAYLARTRLDRLPAHVSVEFVPVLFAGLLSHFGQLGPAEVGP